MFEEMSNSCKEGFVRRSSINPDLKCNDRRTMILKQHDSKSVLEFRLHQTIHWISNRHGFLGIRSRRSAEENSEKWQEKHR